MALSFSVSNWAAWGHGLEKKDDWLSSQKLSQLVDGPVEVPDIKDLPMMLRRRLSRLGCIVMRVTNDLNETKLPLIFSSRYGESEEAVKLFQSLSVREPLSPSVFSTSVHNGLAGLFSVMSKNKQAHTAISAGRASFCNGLLEACSILNKNPQQPVLFVHYDVPLASFYQDFGDETVKPIAIALKLEKRNRDQFLYSVSKNTTKGTAEDAALSFMDCLLKNKNEWSWNDGRTQWSSKHVE